MEISILLMYKSRCTILLYSYFNLNELMYIYRISQECVMGNCFTKFTVPVLVIGCLSYFFYFVLH